MYKIKKTIYVQGQTFEIWLGLQSKQKNGKNGRYTVYLLTDDPDNAYNHAEPILTGIISKKTAIEKGIEYAKSLYRNIIENQKDISEE